MTVSVDSAALAERRRALMRRCAMSEVTTYNWSFEEDVEGYARAGWGGIGVWLHKLEQGPFVYERVPTAHLDVAVVEAAAEKIRDAGLGVASVICAGGFTEPDSEALQIQLEHARFAIDASRRLGTECLVIVPGFSAHGDYELAMRRAAAALSELCEPAADAGVKLAIEPVHPRHTDFVNTLGQALELVERVDHDACGIFFDTFQLHETPDLFAEIEASKGRIFGVHVADSPAYLRSREDRSIPGEGVLALGKMLRAVIDAGYDGWFDIELMSRELWSSNYEDVLERCARGLTDLLLSLEEGPDDE